MLAELIGPQYGLFGSRDGGNTVEPNQFSGMVYADHLVHFELLGKVVMVALRNGEVIEGLALSRPFRKLVLGLEPDAEEDLPAIDHDLYENSIRRVRENNVTGWGLDFTMPLLSWPGQDSAGNGDITGNKRKSAPELCAGGAIRDVTEANKAEYLRLMQAALLRHYRDGIAAQTAAFRRGMMQLCGNEHVFRRLCRLVTPADFDLLVGGVVEIDVDAWQQHTTVKPAGAAGDAVVGWFWEIVRTELTAEQRSQLLEFTTGCGRVPVGGFAQLAGFNGAAVAFTLTVLPFDARNATVKAATCFNNLRVQRYASRAALRERLLSAIAHREGFNEYAVGQ